MENLYTKLKLLSAALIATAMITTAAMARTNNTRHLVEDANASIAPGARNGDERPLPLCSALVHSTQPWEDGPLRTFAGY